MFFVAVVVDAEEEESKREEKLLQAATREIHFSITAAVDFDDVVVDVVDKMKLENIVASSFRE